MDTDQLFAFERIVKEGSISRAARGLNISQPTISARIQALEHEVGGTLFLRSGRKITLTERGESFLPYARRALAVLVEGVEAAQATQAGKRGRITIGTIESLSEGFLASAIARFYKAHPKVEFFVRTGHSDQVVEMLYDGVAKIGLINWPYFNPDLTPLLRFHEPLVLVAPASHPLIGRGSVSAQEIHNEGKPLLLAQWGPSMHAMLAKVMPHAERTMVVPVNTVRDLLARGIGVAFLTRALVREGLAAGRLAEIEVNDLPQSFRESMLVCLNRGAPLPAAVTDFVTVLREEADEFGCDEVYP